MNEVHLIRKIVDRMQDKVEGFDAEVNKTLDVFRKTLMEFQSIGNSNNQDCRNQITNLQEAMENFKIWRN